MLHSPILKGLSIQIHFKFKFKIKLIYGSNGCVIIPCFPPFRPTEFHLKIINKEGELGLIGPNLDLQVMKDLKENINYPKSILKLLLLMRIVDEFGNPELFLLQLWITCGFYGLLCMLCLFYFFFLLEKQLENRHPAVGSLGP